MTVEKRRLTATILPFKNHDKERAIKGPGFRLDLEARRIWQCPRCNAKQKTSGEITSCQCNCTSEGTWMKLAQDSTSTRHFSGLKVRPPKSKTGMKLPPDPDARPEVITPSQTDVVPDLEDDPA